MADMLAAYMQGVPKQGRSKILPMAPRTLCKLYRAPKRNQEFNPGDNILGEFYALRRDRNVTATDLEGVMQYGTAREYICKRDILADVTRPYNPKSLGFERVGIDPMGEEPPNAPAIGRFGSNAVKSLILQDTEAREVYAITGVTRDTEDATLVIIHCEKETTY